jgi:hypothetical protein
MVAFIDAHRDTYGVETLRTPVLVLGLRCCLFRGSLFFSGGSEQSPTKMTCPTELGL